ncbi:MAG: TIR domain-containing protein [Oscillospiraceae bacterium]
MKNTEYFKPYEGDEPYIFISYAHTDSREVLKIISDMHDRGFRIWYDEGIEAGSEWTECIASHLGGAALMIGFVSESYMSSANCRREMNFAVQKKIKVLNIYLSPTTLTPGMELQIGGIWALMKYAYPSDAHFYMKLYEAPALLAMNLGGEPSAPAAPPAEARPEPRETPRRTKKAAPPSIIEGTLSPDRAAKRKKARRITAVSIVSVLTVAIITLLIVGYFTGFLGRMQNKFFAGSEAAETLPADTVAQFKNPIVEAAARIYCGKGSGDVTVGDLTGLTQLYFFGESYSYSDAYAPPALTSEQNEYTAEDGALIARGGISDLSDFAYFPSLTTLQLSFESLTSLETLPAMNLRTLIISSNRLSSLSGVGRLPLLTELNAAHNPLTDAGDVGSCAGLAVLDLSGASIDDWSAFKALPKLTSAVVSGANFAQLKPLLSLRSLTELSMHDCDLRGGIFDRLDSPKLRSLRLTDCSIDGFAGAEELSGLTELWLVRVSGTADFSALSALPALSDVHIDESMEQFFTGSLPFELIRDAE